MMNYLPPTELVSIERCENLHSHLYENGAYVINGWRIAGRKNFYGDEDYDGELARLILEIDKAQPKKMRLSEYEKSNIASIVESIT